MIALNASQWIKSLIIQLFNSLWKRKSLVIIISILIIFTIIALHLNLVLKQSGTSSDQTLGFIKDDQVAFLKPIDVSNISYVKNVLPRPIVHILSEPPKGKEQVMQSIAKPQIQLPSGEPDDPEMRKKRNFIKNMMRLAWDGYVNYAWGENELRPISNKGHSPGIFGQTHLGILVFFYTLFYYLPTCQLALKKGMVLIKIM